MSRKNRHKLRSDTSDYHKGYADGMKAAFEESELDAYYTGVGYGKKQAGDKHIGFNSDLERQQFEAGMFNKDKHFRAYQSEPLTIWDRLFGFRHTDPRRMIHTKKNAQQRVNRTSVKRRKTKKQRNKLKNKLLSLVSKNTKKGSSGYLTSGNKLKSGKNKRKRN